MSIALILKAGEGSIFPNHAKTSDKDPLFLGWMEFPLDEQKKNSLRLDVAVWRKNNSGKDFYSLSIGGIPATLFKEEKQDRPESSPDYAGSFGFGREMRIAGWRKKTKEGDNPYISISVVEKKAAANSERAQTPAAAQEQKAPPRQPAPSQEAAGHPGFDFV